MLAEIDANKDTFGENGDDSEFIIHKVCTSCRRHPSSLDIDTTTMLLLVTAIAAVRAAAFACTNNSHPRHRALSIVTFASRDDGPNDALRQSIQNMVSILNSDETTAQSSSINDQEHSVVNIIGTGLTPTLLSLPLSTLHMLSQADVVLYDSLGLSHHDICQIVPNSCKVICVGKRGDRPSVSWKQNDIDNLLVDMAMEQPRRIVRLKGGDPFLFGRTRSEIETLRAKNISYTYTPGISSCIAGPHLGGIPLTDTELGCQSFGVWSGTDAFGKSRGLNDTNEADFTANVDVLVFLMIGRLDKLKALCQLLVSRGENTSTKSWKWNADTPCAVIQNAGGSTGNLHAPDQKIWRGTLRNIVSTIQNEDETCTSVSPAVFVVGRVCELDLRCHSGE